MHITNNDLRIIADALADDPRKSSPRTQWLIVAGVCAFMLIGIGALYPSQAWKLHERQQVRRDWRIVGHLLHEEWDARCDALIA